MDKEINDLKKKLEEANRVIAQQRTDYMKEINQLKNQSEYLTRIKMHGYKFIDVKFYDATELLNKDMRELINGKIKQMRDQYELSLIDMQERNKYLQQ